MQKVTDLKKKSKNSMERNKTGQNKKLDKNLKMRLKWQKNFIQKKNTANIKNMSK